MNMRLRPFGRTGLMISPFTLGSMEFGSKVDPTEASRLLDRAIEAGVNQPAPDARLSPANEWGAKHFTRGADAAVTALVDCAKDAGVTLTALGLAWTLQRPGITTIVLGPELSISSMTSWQPWMLPLTRNC